MKKLITIVALATTIIASPAFAGYDPGPTTGSASNRIEHTVGHYVQQSQSATKSNS
jgi:hypothetical protein